MGKSFSQYHPFVILLVLSVSLSISNGLQCWICTNARSAEHCEEIGHLRTCQTGQEMVCQTEIRRHAGFRGRPFITKRCKQSQACENEKRQNKSQCRKRQRNSVCRCCCAGDRCNFDYAECQSTRSADNNGKRFRCLQTPEAPTNGEMECSHKKFLGEIKSSCMFQCEEGYVLNGKDISTCLQRSSSSQPTFDPAPTCVLSEDAIAPAAVTLQMKTIVQSVAPTQQTTPQTRNEDICRVIPASPPLGGRSCINVDSGVVCTYFCPEGQNIIGTAVITCTAETTGWSGGTPRCSDQCEDIGSGPVNGVQNCFGSGSVGSYCDFSCDPGYRLVGQKRLKCIRTTEDPSWSSTIPFCRIDIPK